MQLILELFKKIFVALQGVYTKQESDIALATEAQAREQADAKLDAEIDWLKTAVDGDWKTYMLARAKLTGTQKNIDTVNRAIEDYIADNSAALPRRMQEDWKNLYSAYESWLNHVGEESKLTVDFWRAYFDALHKWLENTSYVERWDNSYDSSTGVFANSNPYKDYVPDYIVDFNVVSAAGFFNHSIFPNVSYNSFAENQIPKVLYCPNNLSLRYAFKLNNSSHRDTVLICADSCDYVALQGSLAKGGLKCTLPTAISDNASTKIGFGAGDMTTVDVFTPRAKTIQGLFGNWIGSRQASTQKNITVYAPRATAANGFINQYSNALSSLNLIGGLPLVENLSNFVRNITSQPKKNLNKIMDGNSLLIGFPKVSVATNAFSWTMIDQGFSFPSLHTGDDMFLDAGMSAANISAVLDSLPSDPVGAGGTGVITFTGCPGAAELTQESESVAAATARGWTVEL